MVHIPAHTVYHREEVDYLSVHSRKHINIIYQQGPGGALKPTPYSTYTCTHSVPQGGGGLPICPLKETHLSAGPGGALKPHIPAHTVDYRKEVDYVPWNVALSAPSDSC